MSEPQANPSENTTERGNRRKLTGRIVNDTANPGRAKKTVVVLVERRFTVVSEGEPGRSTFMVTPANSW